MDIKVLARRMVFHFQWILVLIVMESSVTLGDHNYNSHKTAGISHIPWDMLLDPNYTSHKLTPTSNRTSFSPSHQEEYSPPVSFSHQQNSFNLVKDSANPGIYYVPPPTTQYPFQSHNIKYSAPLVDTKLSGSYSSQSVSHRPSEKIMFPATLSHQLSNPQISHYVPPPRQKSKKTSQILKANNPKRPKNRKPDDYFDIDEEDEDYLDSYYQDYDYPEKERISYKLSKPSFQFNKNKEVGDPLGLLPSASDPDGFFSKAKDLLRGGSYSKPSHSSSGSNYYSNYSPNYSPSKHFTSDTEPYGGHSYYDHENVGFPSKDNHYGTPGYDYDTAYGDGHYGGIIPYPDKRKGSKYGPLAFALGLLPLGLLLASLVPTVVTIPVTTAVATGRRRKRSVQFVNPVLETISEYGVTALEDPSCLNRIFCQVVRDGKQERSSIVQKLYFKIANVLDEKIAAYIGLKPLLLAVRKDECHIFECSSKRQYKESNKE